MASGEQSSLQEGKANKARSSKKSSSGQRSRASRGGSRQAGKKRRRSGEGQNSEEKPRQPKDSRPQNPKRTKAKSGAKKSRVEEANSASQKTSDARPRPKGKPRPQGESSKRGKSRPQGESRPQKKRRPKANHSSNAEHHPQTKRRRTAKGVKPIQSRTIRSVKPQSARRRRTGAPQGQGRSRSGASQQRRLQGLDLSAISRSFSQRPAVPLIVGAIGVVVVILLAVFVVRSCTSGSTQDTQQGGEGGTEVSAAQADAGTDIKLLMVGDILFHYQVRQSGLQSDETRNYDHVFANFQSELADKDIKVVNQETPLGGPKLKEFVGDAPDGYGSYPTFNGPQEMGDAEAKAGFNVILKATNHALDAAYEGLSSELEFWEDEHPDVKVIGAVNPESSTDSVDDVYVFEKDGFKVALLNYTFGLNGMPDSKGVMSMLEEEHIKDTMEEAQKKADMIVVFPHWGEEYQTAPNAEQREWAKLFVQEGADVILGNHPHVMQPVEVFANEDGDPVPCFWSTGNFVSTSPDDMSLLGGVPELTLHKDADGNCSITSAEMKVVVTHLGLGDDMTVYPLTEWTDALASTNKLNTEMNPNTDNSTLTPEWAAKFCTEVLGSDYDTKTATLVVDLSKTTSPSSSSKDSQNDDSTSTKKESDSNSTSSSDASASSGSTSGSRSTSGSGSTSTSTSGSSSKTSSSNGADK